MSSDSDALAHGLSVPIAAGELGEPVPAALSFTECSNQGGFQGDEFFYRVVAAGYPAPTYSLNVASAALPDGLTLSSDGVISGTIAEDATVGDYGIIIDATNSEGTDTCTFDLIVYESPTPPIIVAIGDQTVSIGQSVELAVSTSQGTPEMTWTEVGLPASLTIAPTEATSTKATISGVISATEGAYSSTITATNSEGSDNEPINWTVVGGFWAPFTDIEARYDFTDLSTMYSSQAAQFDGTNYLEKASGANQIENYPLSIVAWIQSNTAATQSVLWLGNSGSTTRHQYVSVTGTEVSAITRDAAGVFGVHVTDIAPNDGNWHMVAGVFTDSGRTAFGDTFSANDPRPAPITSPYNKTAIGRFMDQTPSSGFIGSIDNSSIWQAALTAGEISWLYNQGAGRTWNELVDAFDAGEENAPDYSTCRGWWGLDEHRGIRMDQSGAGMHMADPLGTVVGVAGHVEGPAIPEDRATSFDGVNQYLHADEPDWRASDNVGAVTAWVKVQPGDAAPMRILGSGDLTAASRIAVYLHIATDNYICIVTQQNGGTVDDVYGSTTPVSDGDWHLVGVVSNGSAWSFYVDGILQTATVIAGTNSGDWFDDVTNRDNVTIATLQYQSGIGDYFHGDLDEVAYWSDILDATDMQELYNNGIGLLASDVVANGLPTSGKKPVNAWNLDANNPSGSGEDIAGTVDLTPINGPTDAEGIPAGQYIGALVTRVVDQSGNDNDLIQADLNKRPQVVRVDDGTGYALMGDGVDDVLQSAAFSAALSQPTDIYVVADSTAAGTYVDGIAVGNKQEVSRQAAAWRINAGAAQDGGTPDNDLHVLLGGFDGASSALYVDGGTADIQGDASVQTMTGVSVFADYSGAVNLSGTYRQLVVHNSQSGRDAIGNKLAGDQGLDWTDIT